ICLQWGKVPQEINKSLGEDIVTPIAVLSDHNPGPRGGIAGALSDLFDEVTVDLWRLSGAEVGSAAFDDAKELCRCWELMLGLPYAANSTRLPLRFQQIRNAVIAHDCFLDLAEIQRILNERTRAYVRPGTVELPVLLTAVIERATEPTALWEQVARLRKAA